MLERLRPLLVGKDTRRRDWVVQMVTLGGVAVFGINGSVIGPMTAAIFFVAWQIMLLDWRGTLSEGDDGTGGQSTDCSAERTARLTAGRLLG